MNPSEMEIMYNKSQHENKAHLYLAGTKQMLYFYCPLLQNELENPFLENEDLMNTKRSIDFHSTYINNQNTC